MSSTWSSAAAVAVATVQQAAAVLVASWQVPRHCHQEHRSLSPSEQGASQVSATLVRLRQAAPTHHWVRSQSLLVAVLVLARLPPMLRTAAVAVEVRSTPVQQHQPVLEQWAKALPVVRASCPVSPVAVVVEAQVVRGVQARPVRVVRQELVAQVESGLLAPATSTQAVAVVVDMTPLKAALAPEVSVAAARAALVRPRTLSLEHPTPEAAVAVVATAMVRLQARRTERQAVQASS